MSQSDKSPQIRKFLEIFTSFMVCKGITSQKDLPADWQPLTRTGKREAIVNASGDFFLNSDHGSPDKTL